MDRPLAVRLLRHGLTEENVFKRYVGWGDPSLCQEGINRLKQKRNAIPSCRMVISSDLKRCVQTAKIYFPNQHIEQWKEFRELNFGKWDGYTFEELKDDPLYQAWLTNPDSVCPPGGETFVDFQTRVNRGIDRLYRYIKKRDVSHVAIITHSGVIRYWLTRFAPKQRSFWEWHAAYGEGYELVWSRLESLRRGERCISLREVPLTENESG